MQADSAAAALTLAARQQFFERGVMPAGALAPHIARSWQRCSTQLRRGCDTGPVSRADLSDRREQARWLLRCAQPELDALAEHVVGPGCVVILSDADGLILDEVGSPDFLPKAHRLSLSPGMDWSEASRGTNAIGTALAERDAVMVLGPEHYLAAHGSIGCAAAPILDARGRLAGVLDVSGESVRVDVHALGLVRMAAAQVEHRMLSRDAAEQRHAELVHFHWRPGLLGTAREAVLRVVDGRITGLNRAAIQLLGQDWAEWLDRPVQDVFGSQWRSLRDRPGLFSAADGRQWAVAVDRPAPPASSPTPTHAATPVRTPAAAAETSPAADALQAPLERARRVLDAGLPVLLSGETGSGKDRFARRLHAASRRAQGPFVAVNCAALPESLIEAELFGHEPGAFTGARRQGAPGRLREADGGLLFLDEIGDMPLALQTRLLRVLEERKVRPLGGARDVAVDFSLVCASHRDLAQLVRSGQFREDLLYRLRGHAVQLPPLRARADLPQLVQALLAEVGAAARGVHLSPAALQRLLAHRWPGNVRELLAVLRAAVALAEDGQTLEPADLPISDDDAGNEPEPQAAAPAALAEITRGAVQDALATHGGHVGRAAASLGLHRSTLYRMLARQGRGA